jgi:hypothetical protein
MTEVSSVSDDLRSDREHVFLDAECHAQPGPANERTP